MATWNLTQMNKHVLICNGSTCMRKGGEEVTQAIREEINRRELDASIHTTRTRCNGRCKDGCVVVVYPEADWYFEMDEHRAREMVASHLQNNQPLKKWIAYERSGEGMQLLNSRFRGTEKGEKK
ncbi:(2Fe-2S) ferredoxin domain-containing protein [Domibacillus indicus]|uniref:(2Fe-2S) ferredoxin domain-containing protein n=1 Tax=Domibacillus indicus TaxID=1437523 RepID=UPI000617D0C5|nr:(2Fe-2S) ferredoxin domain-containing protein [Domibacillus indicus]